VPTGGGTFKYNLRFPGQLYDSQAGIMQNYFRDYDPAIGRYKESDPIGLKGGSASTYSYARLNPVSFVDPTGLVPNPAEATCIDPLQPICWVGVIADIATTIGGGAVVAGALSVSGDTPSSNVIPFPQTKSASNNCPLQTTGVNALRGPCSAVSCFSQICLPREQSAFRTMHLGPRL
jgi:RHS repeat-associated protein